MRFRLNWRWLWLVTFGLLLTAQSAWAAPVTQDAARLLLAGSRYVYHPSLYKWDVQAFLETHAPSLAALVVETGGGPLPIADAILVQAHYTSLNPQLLLALMDYRSGLLSTAAPTQEQIDRAFGYSDPAGLGFGRQLARAAEELFDAFYFFYYDDPTFQGAADNAATAALLAVLTGKRDPAAWSDADWAAGYRFQERFAFYFGDPLPEITVAANSEQPVWRLPWVPGEQWRYGQGPHRNNPASADTRLVALDFVPTGSIPADSTPCEPDDGIVRDHWIAAAAPGQIVLSVGSLVVVRHNDVWSTGYYHVAQSGRRSTLDDQLRIGHPSNGCVGGGYSTTSHVHFTIRENGVMIPIAGQKLSGWIVEDTRLVREDDPSQVVLLGRLVPSEPAPPPAPINHTKPVSIPVSWWYTFHTSSGGDFRAWLDEQDLFTVKGPARCGNGAKTLFLERGVYQLRIERQPEAPVPVVEMLQWPAPIPCGASLPLPAPGEPQPPTGQAGLSPAGTLDGASLIKEGAPSSPVAPGQTLTYTWRLKNSGGSTWDQRYSLVFVGGTPLGAPAETALRAVAPAQEVDLSVEMNIPASTPAGEVAGYFRLRNGQGAYFGPILSARVRVAGEDGDTPLPAPLAADGGETITPSLSLTPSLALESYFIVTWTTAAQGANAYDVQFARLPDGPWLDWLVGYPHTSALFSGQFGHTYCFRSRAHPGSVNVAGDSWQAAGCRQVNPAGAAPEAWWDTAYAYRRGLLVANLMNSVPLTVGQPIRLYLDDTTSPTAQALYAASASAVKGEDVRLVYQDDLELERQIISFTPSAVDIRFAAQAEIEPNGVSTAYALYYGNSAAGAPLSPLPPKAEEEAQSISAFDGLNGEPAPLVLLGRERGQAAPGQADLSLSSLTAQPDGKGSVLVQAVVENRGEGSTQAEFFVHLFKEQAAETPADLAAGLGHWVLAPLASGQAVTLSTMLTGLQPLSSTDQVMSVSAVADSTGVISDANRTDNAHPGVQFCLAGEDAFEGDDGPSAAPLQPPGVTTHHNFAHAGDQDWLRFAAEAGVTYRLYTHSLGEPVDTWLALYGPDGAALLAENDDHAGAVSSYLEWVAPKSGVYFVQVRPWNPTLWGCNTGYGITILAGDMVLTPELVEPADGAVMPSGSLTLTWQAAPGLEKYRLQIALCPNFSATRVDVQVNSPSYTATGLGNGLYHWRVQGAGADGRWGEWSPAWRFTVAPAGTANPQQPPSPGAVPLFIPLLQTPGC